MYKYCMRRQMCNNQFIITTHSLFNLPEKKITYKNCISKYQEYQNLKPHYMLTIKHFLKSKENSKLLLNMRLILSSNKIKLLQKKLYITLLKIYARQQNLIFYILHPVSKNWELCISFQPIKLPIFVRANYKWIHVLHTYRNRKHTDI